MSELFKPSGLRSFIRDFININGDEVFVKNVVSSIDKDLLKEYSLQLLNGFQHEFINKQTILEGTYDEDKLVDEFLSGDNINIL